MHPQTQEKKKNKKEEEEEEEEKKREEDRSKQKSGARAAMTELVLQLTPPFDEEEEVEVEEEEEEEEEEGHVSSFEFVHLASPAAEHQGRSIRLPSSCFVVPSSLDPPGPSADVHAVAGVQVSTPARSRRSLRSPSPHGGFTHENEREPASFLVESLSMRSPPPPSSGGNDSFPLPPSSSLLDSMHLPASLGITEERLKKYDEASEQIDTTR